MQDLTPNFAGVNIDVPLSLVHNKAHYYAGLIGQLNSQSNGAIYIQEVPQEQRMAPGFWRVVDIEIIPEDTTMTRLFAFDLEGNPRPEATFGVASTNSDIPPLNGPYTYWPNDRNQKILIDNAVWTGEGGQRVMVLDRSFPSESLSIARLDIGNKHGALKVVFRLFERGGGVDGYPNDLIPSDGALGWR
jgi:hypothetical protein